MSSIGFEKRWNPLLSRPRDEFIAALANVPERPADMDRIMRLNRGTLETAA